MIIDIRIDQTLCFALEDDFAQIITSFLTKPPPQRLNDDIVDTLQKGYTAINIRVDLRGEYLTEEQLLT